MTDHSNVCTGSGIYGLDSDFQNTMFTTLQTEDSTKSVRIVTVDSTELRCVRTTEHSYYSVLLTVLRFCS